MSRESDTYHKAVYDAGVQAGTDAGKGATPEPMVVVERANPLDDTSPIVRQYAPVMDGSCGFAWVQVKPGNCSFANWLKKNGHARRDSYRGGVSIWISAFGQSYERKMAYAHAMAETFRAVGIDARGDGRED